MVKRFAAAQVPLPAFLPNVPRGFFQQLELSMTTTQEPRFADDAALREAAKFVIAHRLGYAPFSKIFRVRTFAEAGQGPLHAGSTELNTKALAAKDRRLIGLAAETAELLHLAKDAKARVLHDNLKQDQAFTRSADGKLADGFGYDDLSHCEQLLRADWTKVLDKAAELLSADAEECLHRAVEIEADIEHYKAKIKATAALSAELNIIDSKAARSAADLVRRREIAAEADRLERQLPPSQTRAASSRQPARARSGPPIGQIQHGQTVQQ
jgi:hypothetical protein